MPKFIQEKERRQEIEAAAEKAKQWLLESADASGEVTAALRVSRERGQALASARAIAESDLQKPVTL